MLQSLLVKDIQPHMYLKSTEAWQGTLQKSAKDLELSAICSSNLSKIQKIVNNIETIQYINEQHLRERDLE
jgi:hypothetical protein